jgi:hypothetical protein
LINRHQRERFCRGLSVPFTENVFGEPGSPGRTGHVSFLRQDTALGPGVPNSVSGNDCRSPLVTERGLKFLKQDDVNRVSDPADQEHDNNNLIDVI